MFIDFYSFFIIFEPSRELRGEAATSSVARLVASRFDDLGAEVGQRGACPATRHQARAHLSKLTGKQ